MVQTIKHPFIAVIAAGLLVSCNGNKNEEDLSEDILPQTNTFDSTRISAQNVFNSIPSRTQVVSLTTEAGSQYDPSVLNNPDEVSKYSIESSKALNLGVYGSDLSAAGVYEQTQESMLYLKCVNILAKNLGVSSAFDEKMVDRMEANKENRDSTLEIISQSFKKADGFLKANGRPGTSSLIVAGAWVEAMYIACHTAMDTKNEHVIREIFNQQESLRHLIELLEHSKVSADAQYVTKELEDLKKVMEAKTDKVYNTDALKDLFARTEQLRKKITTAS